jgi:hypothetical protein
MLPVKLPVKIVDVNGYYWTSKNKGHSKVAYSIGVCGYLLEITGRQWK